MARISEKKQAEKDSEEPVKPSKKTGMKKSTAKKNLHQDANNETNVSHEKEEKQFQSPQIKKNSTIKARPKIGTAEPSQAEQLNTPTARKKRVATEATRNSTTFERASEKAVNERNEDENTISFTAKEDVLNFKSQLVSLTQVQANEESTPTPEYQVEKDQISSNKKIIKFENMIAQENILNALNQCGYFEPSVLLQTCLPAALRGSDIFINKREHQEGFLIGVIPAAALILNENISKGEPSKPAVLFLSVNEQKLVEVYEETRRIFQNLDLSFGILHENLEPTSVKSLLETRIDVLFATPESLSAVKHSSVSICSRVGLCYFYGLDRISAEKIEIFDKIMQALPQERTQKIFVSSENNGQVRELAFKYLEDPETFYLLPSYVQERFPKQFSHAVQTTQKFQVLLGYLKTHRPKCAVVFANTKTVAEWIAFKLHGNGIRVELVTTTLPLRKRMAVAKTFQSPHEEASVVVATDSVVKNFGLTNLNCIYNFDIPAQADNFIDRLMCIESSRNPIVVSFVCEDYGYNMKSVEGKLGFKIRVAHVDRNFFNMKDTSEYPLEADGRVKKIGSIALEPIASEQQPSSVTLQKTHIALDEKIPAQPDTVHLHLKPRPKVTSPEAERTPEQSSTKMGRHGGFARQERSGDPAGRQSSFSSQSHQQRAPFTREDYSQTRMQDKFIRRDDRAKDVIDNAKNAARLNMERKQAEQYGRHSSPVPAGSTNTFVNVVSILQDAVQAAGVAARESLTQGIESTMPRLSAFLKKYRIIGYSQNSVSDKEKK